MPAYTQDKHAERTRYDERARTLLAGNQKNFGPHGAAAVALAIRRPYVIYERYIRNSVHPRSTVLDVCCGTGLFSLIAASAGAEVTASDIAENNLVLARLRATQAGFDLRTTVADAEKLPFAAASFDVITCAGSLSYLDRDSFFAEVKRLLRPGGWFVCVDSLNHNPIYRFNRYLQFLRGRRTAATLVRMPTMATLAYLRETFNESETSFHGTSSFAAPFLTPLMGEQRVARILDGFDAKTPSLHRWAFKFVFRGRRNAR